jgi:hypothetical protein
MYLVDSDVLIQATRRHYRFKVCPAFWSWLESQHADGNVQSVARILEEVTAGTDDLSSWAAELPASFFPEPDEDVLEAMRRVSTWANDESGRSEAAITEFLDAGDYYLVAHALAHDCVVVTHERSSTSLNKIKIPDACAALGIRCIDPFDMLSECEAKFVLDD